MDRKKEIETIRQFNRYYTNLLGVLDKNFLGSSFSLAEIRRLYFIQITPESSLKKIAEHFHLNKGYLSRTVKKLEQEGYILRTKFETDGRSAELSLTEAGLKTICQPNDASDHSIPDMIAHLTDRRFKIWYST
ncbi:MAG: MarR family transcriptional regulator [Lachnospiraceae bacterium]|nr:MarR family transcriptional regulator [Lachnospiraceae bacterium]